jgi:hypothetical protein
MSNAQITFIIWSPLWMRPSLAAMPSGETC